MTWTSLLANKEAQKHKTSKKELDNMRALIARDLADAASCWPFRRSEIRHCLQRCTPGREHGDCLCGISDHEQGRTSPGVVGKHETCVGKPCCTSTPIILRPVGGSEIPLTTPSPM